MSDIIVQQLQHMRSESLLYRNDVMKELGDLRREVTLLVDRVSSIETLIVRQQRQLYEVIDRQH